MIISLYSTKEHEKGRCREEGMVIGVSSVNVATTTHHKNIPLQPQRDLSFKIQRCQDNAALSVALISPAVIVPVVTSEVAM